ncbi:SAM-dependent methyltransferase [Planctomycetes bacterium CA13]
MTHNTDPSASPAPTFAFVCCAYGAEQPVKDAITTQGWRLAFSRPGFVTAKHDDQIAAPEGVFVRTSSLSIGQARGGDGNEMIDSLLQQIDERYPSEFRFDQLHVWPKDRAAIGRFGFEPGVDEVSKAVGEEIYRRLAADRLRCDAVNRVAQPGESILDVVLVEPSHWFFGTHKAQTWPTRWPGGVQPIDLAEPPVSRAYYKAAESIQWSGFDIHRGDIAAEIGAAPGGACQRLLELGLKVMGIDPAEMDPQIAEHPNFRYVQARADDLPRREYSGVKWILVDSTVKPEQTLTTVGKIVTHRNSDVRGLLITMKLGDYQAAKKIDTWIDKVQSWNPVEIRVRQLARNRCEVCFAVRMV